MQHARQSKYRSAFTIVELLVAAAVTLVLVGIMLQITVQTLGIWNQTSGRLTAGNQAKLALDFLEEDFQSLILRDDGLTRLLITVENPNATSFLTAAMADAKWNATGVTGGRVKPGHAGDAQTSPTDSLDFQTNIAQPLRRDLSEYRFGQAGVWLRMITHQRTSGGTSAPVAVGYQIVRISPVDGNPGGADPASAERRYQLYRSAVSTQNTLNAGYNLAMPAIPGPSYNAPNGTDGVAGNISRPSRSFLLANNVVDFGIRLWSREGNGSLTLLFPRDATNLAFSGPGSIAIDPPPPSALSASITTAGVPAVADLFIRVLTDEGARLLENFEYGRTDREVDFANDDEYWWALVTKHSQVYTRRVNIVGALN